MAQTLPPIRAYRDGLGFVWHPQPFGRFVTTRRVGQDEIARMARRRHRRGWPA